MAPIKLYGTTLSPNVVRVAAVLNEKGLDFELVPVDLRTGAHKHPDFLALNVRTARTLSPAWLLLRFFARYWTEFPVFLANFPGSAAVSFLFLQPFGQIPALLDGDEVLYGNSLIILCSAHPSVSSVAYPDSISACIS